MGGGEPDRGPDTIAVGPPSQVGSGGAGIVPGRIARGWTLIALLAVVALTLLAACGEGGSDQSVTSETDLTRRSAATFLPLEANQVLTEADAGKVIVTERFIWDIGLFDKKGTEIILEGDDASSLRWRFAEKPDAFHLEWIKVDGEPAFETDGLLGDPTTAAKVLEFHGQAEGGTTKVVLELVERDPARRTGEPAKRLEYTFQIIREVTCFQGNC